MSADSNFQRHRRQPDSDRCNAHSPDCCGDAVDRRDFIKLAGAGAAAAAASGLVATEITAQQGGIVDHFIPADKRLDPEWVQALFARGTRRVYRDKQLETIGMPCGGICAGQPTRKGNTPASSARQAMRCRPILRFIRMLLVIVHPHPFSRAPI